MILRYENLHNYQKYCVNAIINNPAIGLFLDTGLGKTATTLHAINQLKYERFSCARVLVISTKKIAEGVWSKEAAKWKELEHLRFSFVLGNEAQRIAALNTPADIYTINVEMVVWLVNYYKHKWPFDMVVLDESSKFKNHRAKRFKALKPVRSRTNRIVELTGSPRPRGLMDLWAQIYLLDGGKRLGRTITAYRDAYFRPGKRNQHIIYDYDPVEGAEDAIYSAISDICITMKKEDYLDLPPMIYDEIPVKLDDQAQKAYNRLERQYLLPVTDESIVSAPTAATLSNKLLQLCNGAVYDDEGKVAMLHNCKIEALQEVVERLNGEQAIVCYYYKHDLQRLQEALSSTGLRVSVYEDTAQQDAWNNGDIDLLLLQATSCAHGLNLQEGGAHHIIWFSLLFDYEVFQQLNDRLHRQGQINPVIVHLLAVQGGRDEDALKSLFMKEKGQNGMFESLKARIEQVKEAA